MVDVLADDVVVVHTEDKDEVAEVRINVFLQVAQASLNIYTNKPKILGYTTEKKVATGSTIVANAVTERC